MKKLFSIILAILMLATSMGLTMGTHFCGGHAMKSRLMLGHLSLDCGMQDMDAACPTEESSGNNHIKMEKCCENHYESIHSEDTVISKLLLTSIDFKFFVVFVFTYLSLNPFEAEHPIPFLSYLPPLLKQDKPILHQVFLL